MNENNDYLKFVPEVTSPKASNDKNLWFIFNGSKILLHKKSNCVSIPTEITVKNIIVGIDEHHYLGNYCGTGCYCFETGSLNMEKGDDLDFVELRSLVGIIDREIFMLAGKALQVINWNRNHKFCGRCGTPTHNLEGQRAKKCPSCNFVSYPRISPAIIVAITKDDSILLAHNNSFVEGLYTVIAGFVEPGETLEQCVKREIFEEVGIKVKNISYFGSEPWPFPDSLMVAFTAKYMEGEITIDGSEIGDAKWYKADELPQVPVKGCIARDLIEWFKSNVNYCT